MTDFYLRGEASCKVLLPVSSNNNNNKNNNNNNNNNNTFI